MTDETTEQIPDNQTILNSINELSKKFDDRLDNLESRFDGFENRFNTFEKNGNLQFEVIREGIAYNSSAFDRMEAKFYEARSDISKLRADVKDLTEKMRQRSRETLV